MTPDEQAVNCELWLNGRLRFHRLGLRAEGRRDLIKIAFRQYEKGLDEEAWRSACEAEFLGTHEVGNPMLIIGAIQIILTLIRIYLEWKKP